MAAAIQAQPEALGEAQRLPLPLARPAASAALDWATVAFSTWLLVGLFADGWAHTHIPQLESFFTPWHGILYSGFAAAALLTLGVFLRNAAAGYHWRNALPAGYGWSLIGAAIFLAGGVGDMVWHMVFSIEASIDALLSPTHLVLAFGGVALTSGPFRSWLYGAGSRPGTGLLRQLPAILSLTYLWSTLTFFTQYVHPYIDTWAAPSRPPASPTFGQALGTVSVIVQAGLLVGVVLLALRRRRLPAGSLTLMLTVNGLLMNLMHGDVAFIPVAFVGGVCGDALLAWLRPSMARPLQLHLFAFLLPLPLYALYFAVLGTRGIIWTVHLWMGSIVIAGISGWLLSYLMAPPAPAADEASPR
jgi:hypothetical protein